MSTITTASRQWASRPADERFLSLEHMSLYAHRMRARGSSRVVSSRELKAAPTSDNQGMVIFGPNGGAVNITNWSFGQLSQRAGAPAGYLRSLPSPVAADCINYGLKFARTSEDLGVLLYKQDQNTPCELRAVTGPNYGRVWNSTIIDSLIHRFGDGVTGQFKVPGEFGKPVQVTKENTTLYASDRDMFVFLADEEHRIEIPNRRDGEPGSLARGFFVWNSEVGKCTLGIATFLFDYVCFNRIVWGAKQYQKMIVRHTASAPDRWVDEVAPAIESYANSSVSGIMDVIASARMMKIKEDLDDFLRSRFSNTQAHAIKAAHMTDEQRPIETLWDAATAVTAYARGIQYQDDRVELEREAGKILALAE
jgi:hypothetical protein